MRDDSDHRVIEMEKEELGRYCLAGLRIMLAWMMLWAFLDKMFGLSFPTPSGSGVIDGVSPSSAVVYIADGVFKDLFLSLAGNGFVDFLMMFGLLAMGTALALGIGTKITTVTSIIFSILMYLTHFPPSDNPIIDYHIFYVFAMLAVYYLGGFEKWSLYARWKEFPLAKRFPILE